jgi:hypothetical protein
MEDKYYVCRKEGCLVAFPEYNSLRMHFLGKHRNEPIPTEEDSAVTELPEGYTVKLPDSAKKKPRNEAKSPQNPDGPQSLPAATSVNTVNPPAGSTLQGQIAQQGSVYKQPTDTSSILRKILSEFPGMKGKEDLIEEIMSYSEYSQGPIHPVELRNLLNAMASPKGAAEIIPQKYQMALMKAAQEGNTTVQMMFSGWQYGQQRSPDNLNLGNIPGQVFPQQPGNQTGMPPLQYGVPYQAPGYPNYSYGQMNPGYPYYGQNQPPSQPPPQEGKQPDPEIEAIKETMAGLTNLVQGLSKQILETEEQKKEEALNARLEKLESLIIQVANTPKTDENANALAEAIKDTQTQIALMREEATANKISSLEERIGTLTDALAQNKDNEIVNLKNQLDELKRTTSEKPPVTGRTEMDIVGDLANKVVEKMGEAGKDVRAVVMRQATAQGFDPNRSKPEDRAKLGDRIASVVEQEALLEQKEDQFRYQ